MILQIPLPENNTVVANDKGINTSMLFQNSRQNISLEIVYFAMYEFVTK
jgi:hypothetical protein